MRGTGTVLGTFAGTYHCSLFSQCDNKGAHVVTQMECIKHHVMIHRASQAHIAKVDPDAFIILGPFKLQCAYDYAQCSLK